MQISKPHRQPACRSIGNGLSITTEDATYEWQYKGRRYKLCIRAGFIFDGASIPRLAWTILGLAPHGDMDGPAIPHDFGYQYGKNLPVGSLLVWHEGEWLSMRKINKGHLDRLLQALIVHFEAAGRFKAWLVYTAVAAFGWVAWHRNDAKRLSKKGAA